MARIRTIKPGFFLDDQLAELPYPARLLFVGLWCIADRQGRLEDRPKRIKAEVLPYDNEDVDALLCSLATAGFIVRYEADGKRYIQVVNFLKHQRPNAREPESTIPAPPEHILARARTCTHMQTHACTPGREGKGREGNNTPPYIPPPGGESAADATDPVAAEPSPPKDRIPYKAIVDHLNEVCGTSYRHTTKATRRLIKARWNEGYRLEDFQAVIDDRWEEWSADPKMIQYLRPETLFGTKFESYLQHARARETVSEELAKEMQEAERRTQEYLAKLLAPIGH